MSQRTTTTLGRVRPVIDENSVIRSDGGRQVDWAGVPDGYKQSDGLKFIPAFTAMGETTGAGKLRPHIDTTNVAIGCLESDAKEGSLHEALTGYGLVKKAYVWENLMPDSTGTGSSRVLPTGLRAALVALGWTFEKYNDAR